MSKAARHADSDEERIERAKRIVARILAMRKGPENAIKGQELADRTPVDYTTLRDTIPEIIAEYQVPIASCPDGYYRIDSHEAFVEEIETFESRRQSARARMQALSRAFYGERFAVPGGDSLE